MCGIVGYVGKRNAKDILLDGLERLEYRGYDSAGVSIVCENVINTIKIAGVVKNLRKAMDDECMKGCVGIGHTRWATHGEPNEINSHPHLSGDQRISVVHNGIIENYEQLKRKLEGFGYKFLSRTDTEVIPHLIEYYYNGDILDAVIKATNVLEGSFAICVICADEPDKIVGIRRDSPLIVGLGCDENLMASDIPAILKETGDIYLLEDNEYVVMDKSCVKIYDKDKNEKKKEIYKVNFDDEAAQKGGYPHFMLKEIHEQPKAIRDTLSGRVIKGERIRFDDLREEDTASIERIVIVGCGTAYHAGVAGKIAIETLAGIMTEVDIASEFRYRNPIIDEKTFVVTISQSGETADTLAALRLAKDRGCKTLAVTNVVGSSISREADFVFYTHAGPEISVASTKAYETQLVSMYIFALFLAQSRGYVSSCVIEDVKNELIKLPEKVSISLKCESDVKNLAKKLCNKEDIYFLGRGTDYAVAMEGSLKLKEISYIHSEAYAGGELKHGPIALMDEGVYVVALNTNHKLYNKMESNIMEVITRGACVVGIVPDTFENTDEKYTHIVRVPHVMDILSPCVCIIPLQLMSYYVATELGHNVDKPRNLAKSVTVE